MRIKKTKLLLISILIGIGVAGIPTILNKADIIKIRQTELERYVSNSENNSMDNQKKTESDLDLSMETTRLKEEAGLIKEQEKVSKLKVKTEDVEEMQNAAARLEIRRLELGKDPKYQKLIEEEKYTEALKLYEESIK